MSDENLISFRKKKIRRDPRALPLDQATDAGRFFNRMLRDIENDLGGRRKLSRIQDELINAFAGAATTLRYLNRQVALGEISEIDLGGFATVASTMLRIGSKLGLSRRKQDDAMSLGEVIAQDQAEERARLAQETEEAAS